MQKTESFADWWVLHKDQLLQSEETGLREIAEAAWNAASEQSARKMDLFVEITAQSRAAQTTYFKDRTSSSLAAAKHLEKKVDRAIAEYRNGTPGAIQLSFTSTEENTNGKSE